MVWSGKKEASSMAGGGNGGSPDKTEMTVSLSWIGRRLRMRTLVVCARGLTVWNKIAKSASGQKPL